MLTIDQYLTSDEVLKNLPQDQDIMVSGAKLVTTKMVYSEGRYVILPDENQEVAELVKMGNTRDRQRIPAKIKIKEQDFEVYLCERKPQATVLELDKDGTVYGLESFYGCENFKFPQVGDILHTNKGDAIVEWVRYNKLLPAHFPMARLV